MNVNQGVRAIGNAILACFKEAHLRFGNVNHASKGFAHAHRPSKWHHFHSKGIFNLIHQLKWSLDLTIHLVNEGNQWRIAGAADL